MADERLREWARLAATGDVEAEAQLLNARIQLGDIDPDKIKIASFIGDPAAQTLFPNVSDEDIQLATTEYLLPEPLYKALSSKLLDMGFILDICSYYVEQLLPFWTAAHYDPTPIADAINAARTRLLNVQELIRIRGALSFAEDPHNPLAMETAEAAFRLADLARSYADMHLHALDVGTGVQAVYRHSLDSDLDGIPVLAQGILESYRTAKSDFNNDFIALANVTRSQYRYISGQLLA